MSKKLIIVESPTKAHTIKKIMGGDFDVVASKGHIRDLPEKTLGVNIEKNFTPKYELSKDKKSTISELRKAASEAEAIYLAPDPDREGEAIAWHLRETLAKSAGKDTPFFRVRYNEITPAAVKNAFANPSDIDMNQVDAQQARRVLDRIVGYKVSPVLWRRLRKGLSAGRVQSVALRLVAERERRIQAFQSIEYWLMGVDVSVKGSDPFYARLSRLDGKAPVTPKEGDPTPPSLPDASSVKSLLDELRDAKLNVGEIKNREISRHALPPFMTSTLQQAASSALGFEPRKTMDIAQALFEGRNKISTGLITYMRTDSVAISADARAQAEKFIKSKYGENYFAQNHYRSRSGAQEAHEAIRPTDITLTPESLRGKVTPQELRLYELIWKRFTASLMAEARIMRKTVYIDAEKSGMSHSYTFSASASEIVFDGFLKVLSMDVRKECDPDSEENGPDAATLPPMSEGDAVDVVEWKSEQKHSTPPARYSEASLIKALEANGVGRPSTYAAILGTLNTRKYTKREKSQLIPTELGLDVSDLLVSKMPALFDVAFTAAMESELDEIEAGRIHWQDMMQNFWERFNRWLEESKEPPADVEKVARALKLLDHVQNWNPSEKRGRRIVGDQPFVESIREQVAEGEKPISEKQLAALVTTAIRYKDQIPDAERAISELGFSEELEKDAAAPSIEDAKRRLAILDAVALNERQIKFVNSLRSQIGIGKKLTAKQMQILESIILENKGAIENFDQIKEELGLCENTGGGNDPVGPAIMQMLSQVVKWKEPVKRGKRIFDDAEFYSSVARQFALRGTLSPKQLWSMKKLCVKYADQISDFNSKAEELGLNPKK